MPDTWIDDHTGDETIARQDFRAQLRSDLAGELRARSPRRTPWKAIGWATVAAAAAVTTVVLVAKNDADPRVVPGETPQLTSDVTTGVTTDATPSLRDQLIDIPWLVTTVNGTELQLDPLPSFTLQGDGHVVGFDGCNSYGFDLSQPGGWTLDGDRIMVDQQFVSTAMLCTDASQPILPVDNGTRVTFDAASGVLTLTGTDGAMYTARQEGSATLKEPRRYVAIGESVMAGATSRLQSAGVYVDTKEGRGPAGLKEVIISLKEAGVIGAGTLIVMQVGTNASLSQTELDAVMAEVPTNAAGVAFMTVHADIAYAEANNALIRAMPGRHPNVSVIDWDAKSSQVELCADGIHISCNGSAPAIFYTNLILEAFGLPALV